jgi:hypothetical protein
MTRRAFLLLVGALLAGGAFSPATAQSPAPLEQFVRRVGYLWEAKDVDHLVDLVTDSEPVLLDRGSGTERVNGRHAAAALRALFSDLESVSVRPAKATVSGGQPVRGFGELTWVYRTRGRPGEQTRSVYVGAVWDGRDWRISELRLLP